MQPVQLADSNIILGSDQEGVISIAATRWFCAEYGPTISVGWQPSPEELERLNKGLPVVVHIRGVTIQPMWVDVAKEEGVADD